MRKQGIAGSRNSINSALKTYAEVENVLQPGLKPRIGINVQAGASTYQCNQEDVPQP
jgi:hypothetical protein